MRGCTRTDICMWRGLGWAGGRLRPPTGGGGRPALTLILRFSLCFTCVFWSLAFVACVFALFALRWDEVMKATRIFRQLYEGEWFHIPGFVIMFALRWVEVMKATRIVRQLY